MTNLPHYFQNLAQSIAALPQKPIKNIFLVLRETYQRDGTIYTCGNGGSASTASHFACDLMKWTITPNKRRVRAYSLTDHLPLLSAWANDSAYEHIFVEQLQNHYRQGDTLVAISGSGNSPNVLNAVAWVNDQKGMTVGLSGFDGGKLSKLVKTSVVVPNNFMPQVEDLHLAICHGLAVELGHLIREEY